MKRFQWLAATLSALFLVACGDDTLVNDYSDAKATGKVAFWVRDKVTGLVIDSAEVEMLSTATKGTVKFTDSTGFAEFKGVTIGSYVFRISKTGYGEMLSYVNLNDQGSDAPRVPDVTLDTEISKIGATVEGRVVYVDTKGNTLDLADAVVDLVLANAEGLEFVIADYRATTSATGEFMFENLPENVQYTVSVRPATIDGKVFSTATTQTVNTVKSGDTRRITPFTLTVQADPFSRFETNVENIVETDDLVVTFSMPVDTARIKLGDIVVSHSAEAQLVTVAWSNGNRTLTISPVDGKWYAGSQTLSYNLYSTAGNALTQNLVFVPDSYEAIPGQVEDFRFTASIDGEDTNVVNSTTSSITLKWTPVANAAGYIVYRKLESDSSFKYFGEINDGEDSSLAVSTAGLFDKGETVMYRILSFNTKGTSSPAGAPELSIKDAVKPEVSSSPASVNAFLSLNNSSFADTLTEADANGSYSFSEAMDTTIVPTITLTNNSGTFAANMIYTWDWTSTSTATVRAYVKPNTNAEGLDIKVTIGISSLKDEAGNSLVSETGENQFNVVDTNLVIEPVVL